MSYKPSALAALAAAIARLESRRVEIERVKRDGIADVRRRLDDARVAIERAEAAARAFRATARPRI